MKGNKSARRSRHFAVETPPSKASIQSATSSKHFLHSPSSAVGSVYSLPNFLLTLVPPHFSDDYSNQDECSCERLAEVARAQFAHCPVFEQRRLSFHHQTSRETSENSMSCCDKSVFEIQSSVCHLCPHGCYLRAFAPLREWHTLRSEVADRSTRSPGVLLQGWRCSLTDSASTQEDGSSSRKRKRMEASAPLVQTVFISPTGKSFKGQQSVLKELGLADTQAEMDDVDTILPRSLNKELSVHKSKQRHSVATSAALFQQSGVSPFGLLEELFVMDPWRLLVSTIMLNRTTRCQVDVVLYKFLQKWPDATSASRANETELADLILPLGLRFRRAAGIIRFSQEWLELVKHKNAFDLSRDDVVGLYNCGEYAYDAYRVFIQRDINAVTTDHALQLYVDYQRGLTRAGHSMLQHKVN